MNKDQWQQIEKIFYAAMELPRDEREAFISQTCAGDEELLREVQALLAANQDAESFLDSPVNMPPHSGTFSPTLVMPHSAANAGAAAESGVRIGAYRLIREIGRGGMGAVWLAERADGQFYQQVAVKLLHAGSENEEVIRRFRHERQILASLDHPNIARLLDGGTTEDGRPYFVMEYIEGLPIDEYCRQHQLSVDDRLKLFRQVCAAVHYAHQNLVIHRDLKPSNIAVTEDGTPKLLDFGIAKLIQPDLSRSYDTLSGVTPMTPAYASPEQVRGEKLTTASDVYSLGVVLYELLTGRSPYRLKAHGFGELMRAVIEQEPERPSTAVTRADETPPTNPITIEPTEKLRRRLSGDIDSIVLMALRKEPPSQYGSVEQFSEDLRRYLEGLPTMARRGTFGYRALKYIRRNKVPVAAAALILLSLVGGIGATLLQARIAKAAQFQAEAEKSEAQSQRNRAETALTTAEERRQQAEAARTEADQQRDEADAQRNVAEEQRTRAESQELSKRRLLYAAQMKLAQTAWDESNSERVGELLRLHFPEPGKPDLRGIEWFWLWRNSHLELTSLSHSAALTSVAFSPEGNSLVTIEGDEEHQILSIRDTATWQVRYQVMGKVNEREQGDIGRQVAFSNDGRIFATGGNSCGLTLWETATGKRLKRIAASDCDFRGLAFSQDGRKLASGHLNGNIFIFDTQSGQELLRIDGQPMWSCGIAFTSDGQKLATTVPLGDSIKLWDANTGKELVAVKKKFSALMTPRFSPDGQSFATGLAGGEILIVDAKTGKTSTPVKAGGVPITLAYSPDGKTLAVASNDRQVNFWETQTWQPVHNIRGFGGAILTMTFSPDGKRLVTGASDYKVQVWDMQQSQEPEVYKLDKGYADKIAFADAGKKLFVLGSDLVTRAYDTLTRHELFSLKGHYLEKPYVTPIALMHALAISDDGRKIATTADESIKIWDAVTGRELHNIRTQGKRNYILAISQDGRMVATNACFCADNDKEKRAVDHSEYFGVWDTVTGRQILNVKTSEIAINRIVFLKDNRTLITVGMSGKGQLTWWNLASGQPIRTINSMARGGYGLSLSPDGTRLAAAEGNGTISLFDAITGQQTGALKGYNSAVRELVFSPDGNRLLTGGGNDRVVKLWDLTTGQELMIFRNASPMGGVAFSSDGQSMAIAYAQGIVKVFTAADPKSVKVASR